MNGITRKSTYIERDMIHIIRARNMIPEINGFCNAIYE